MSEQISDIPDKASTESALSERRPLSDILRQSEILLKATLLTQTLEAMPILCLILNRERQIVFANRAFLSVLNVDDLSAVRGLRLGEALNCLHAFERHEGCGTTDFCETCGAVRSILTSQQGTQDVQECRIIRRGNADALDIRVWAAPITVDGLTYTMVTATDIGDEKRKEVLERIFLHDIANTASAIFGCSELLEDSSKGDSYTLTKKIQLLSARLIEELNAQRQLIAAEKGSLALNPSLIESSELLDEIVAQQGSNKRGHCIRISPASKNVSFTSDRVLVRRVIVNLLKNALEASKDGDIITLGSERTQSGVQFWVHNPQGMERDVQLQMFQRSFSTRGAGRGLGAYSVKLLTQRYLKGSVSFNSSSEEGTTFRVTYPYGF